MTEHIQRMSESGRWQKMAMDGDNSSRGWSRLCDVAPTPQGTGGKKYQDTLDEFVQ